MYTGQPARRAVIGVDKDGNPTPYTEFELPALPWSINYVGLIEPIRGLTQEAVDHHISVTGQVWFCSV